VVDNKKVDKKERVMTRRRGLGSLSLRAVLAACLIAATLLASPSLQAAPDEADLERAKERLMELERDFELVVEKYNLVHERLESLQVEMAAKELVVNTIEKRMATKIDAAVSLAQELYKAGATGVAISSVLSSDSLAELETRVEYLQSSEAAQAKVFERLEVDRIRLDREIEELDDARAKALATEQELAELRSDIEDKLDEQRDEIAAINAAIERADRRAAREAAATARALGLVEIDLGSIKPAPAPNAQAQAAVDAALSQLGKPYQWGASGPDSFDCSGLTMWAWAHAGISMPHNSGAQYSATVRVPRPDLAPGDLLFYGNPIHHVTMYIGNGQMVEAPYTGSHVRVTSVSRSDYVGAGRPGV
jgi:cell wall-associated NlpC family hydrolase